MSKIDGMHNSSTCKNDIMGFMQSDHGFRASYTPQSTSLHFSSYAQCGQYTSECAELSREAMGLVLTILPSGHDITVLLPHRT